MNHIIRQLIKTVEQLYPDEQDDVLAYAVAKLNEPYIMSDAETAACEEGYKDSSRGIFASKKALQKALRKTLNRTKLELTPRAQVDVDKAAEGLIFTSPTVATQFVGTLEGTFNIILRNPAIGRLTNLRDWRMHPMATFQHRIFYRIDNETIIIETVFRTTSPPS